MIVEGEIDINGETKSKGFVFNQKGFFCQAISGDKVVTKSFVTVWAVSLVEMEDLGRTYPQVKVHLGLKLVKNRSEHKSEQQGILIVCISKPNHYIDNQYT
jgi:hypothetical protein